MTEPTTADSNLHNTLVVIVDKEDVSYGEIGYTTVCCSEDKYAVQFPTHKEIINKSSMEVYSCVLDRLETTEQRLREVGAACRETSDDYAPDAMPFEVADVVGRIESILTSSLSP